MKYRKLRIAFSVGCGMLCLLLIVLWVRSYRERTSKEVFVTPTYRYKIYSQDGKLILYKQQRIFVGVEIMLYDSEWIFSELATYAGLGVGRDSGGKLYAVSIPYWLLTVSTILVTAAPWLRWRFGLRTLLIATTVVAVLLGLIVYAAR
jgi:hypothetical protein